jgi:hypothetical protein
MEKIISGLAWHVHHDTLLEWCYNYDERVESIKRSKPVSEQETRLRLLKMLSEEALSELPSAFRKADVDRQKADADRQKAYADWQKADADRQKAYADWQKAGADNKVAITALHAKYCGCKEWNGKELVFPGERNNATDL